MQKLGTSVILDKSKRECLLEYLLSTGRIENIVGIPLIEQVDGTIVSLSQREDTSPNHVLLELQDQEVFSHFDPRAILIATLPSTAVPHLRSTTLLNVEPLKADHVMSYVGRAPSYFGPPAGTPSGISDEYTGWVSKFLEWICRSPLEEALRGWLHHHPLLPVNGVRLKTISSGVFSPKHAYVSGGLVKFLERVGLFFLRPGISDLARQYLGPHLKSLDDPRHVLTSLPPFNRGLSTPGISSLQDYILSHRHVVQRDEVVRPILKKLPIYDHMSPANSSLHEPSNLVPNYSTGWSRIPDGLAIRAVAPDIPLLPIMPRIFFTSQLPLVQILDPTLGITSNTDILELAIHNFRSQPPELQARFLDQLTTTHIPTNSLSRLESIPFLLGADGKRHAPQTLVDPTSKFANLLPPNSPHLPQYQTTLQHKTIASLRQLSLLPNTLTMEIFEEIVDVIVTKQDTQLSNSLLDFLDNDTTSWSLPNLLLDIDTTSWPPPDPLLDSDTKSLPLPDLLLDSHTTSLPLPDLLLDRQWIETTRGLSSPNGSHGHQYAALCNKVLPILKRVRRIQSLRLLKALHWDTPPALRVVVAQFRALVREENPACPELLPVSSFLGSNLRDLSRSGQLQELKQFTKGRNWVPTDGSTFTPTMFAIFKQDVAFCPFKQITSLYADDRNARSFLQEMGCKEE
jgi:hypothetical protein